MSLERVSKAANAAACDTLSQLGPSLVNLGVWTMWTPKIGVTALTLGAASNFAYQYSCAEQQVGTSPSSDYLRGCMSLTKGYGDLRVFKADGTFITGIVSDIVSYKASLPYNKDGDQVIDWTWQKEIGGPFSEPFTYGLGTDGQYAELILKQGAECGSDVPDLPPVPPEVEPYEYTDESGCTLIVDFQGFVQESEGGNVQPVYLIEGKQQELRADGGRIGGCFFEPTIYYGGANGGGDGGCGGGTTIPLPPGDEPPPGPEGEPWWLDLLKGALGSAAVLAADELIDALTRETYPSTIYRLISVCEKNDKGEPVTKAREVGIPILKAPDAQLARLDAIVELLQAQKDFKQPICDPEKPTLEGDWRTISFRSDSTSPYGKSRLCKRFRYRSTSGLGLGEIVDYWKDFTFQSGPVVVIHSGSSWGTPQVWAATADEGKRVIRHAAGEAGIDPDQVGRWTISGSDSARYGVSDTMRVDTTGGYYWITSRDGSNGKPIVAL